MGTNKHMDEHAKRRLERERLHLLRDHDPDPNVWSMTDGPARRSEREMYIACSKCL